MAKIGSREVQLRGAGRDRPFKQPKGWKRSNRFFRNKVKPPTRQELMRNIRSVGGAMGGVLPVAEPTPIDFGIDFTDITPPPQEWNHDDLSQGANNPVSVISANRLDYDFTNSPRGRSKGTLDLVEGNINGRYRVRFRGRHTVGNILFNEFYVELQRISLATTFMFFVYNDPTSVIFQLRTREDGGGFQDEDSAPIAVPDHNHDKYFEIDVDESGNSVFTCWNDGFDGSSVFYTFTMPTQANGFDSMRVAHTCQGGVGGTPTGIISDFELVVFS